MAGSVPLTTLCTAELMVSATVEHAVPAGLPDGMVSEAATFFDLNMAIPDAEHAEYDACETGVAAEYVLIHSAAAYRSGRAAFLRAMLARDRLFHTLASHAVLDTRTRANMRRARAGLEGPPRQADRDATVGTPAKTYDGRAVRPTSRRRLSGNRCIKRATLVPPRAPRDDSAAPIHTPFKCDPE